MAIFASGRCPELTPAKAGTYAGVQAGAEEELGIARGPRQRDPSEAGGCGVGTVGSSIAVADVGSTSGPSCGFC